MSKQATVSTIDDANKSTEEQMAILRHDVGQLQMVVSDLTKGTTIAQDMQLLHSRCGKIEAEVNTALGQINTAVQRLTNALGDEVRNPFVELSRLNQTLQELASNYSDLEARLTSVETNVRSLTLDMRGKKDKKVKTPKSKDKKDKKDKKGKKSKEK